LWRKSGWASEANVGCLGSDLVLSLSLGVGVTLSIIPRIVPRLSCGPLLSLKPPGFPVGVGGGSRENVLH
jgi:hypothetical protein